MSFEQGADIASTTMQEPEGSRRAFDRSMYIQGESYIGTTRTVRVMQLRKRRGRREDGRLGRHLDVALSARGQPSVKSYLASRYTEDPGECGAASRISFWVLFMFRAPCLGSLFKYAHERTSCATSALRVAQRKKLTGEASLQAALELVPVPVSFKGAVAHLASPSLQTSSVRLYGHRSSRCCSRSPLLQRV